jgi:hypothetical protein
MQPIPQSTIIPTGEKQYGAPPAYGAPPVYSTQAMPMQQQPVYGQPYGQPQATSAGAMPMMQLQPVAAMNVAPNVPHKHKAQTRNGCGPAPPPTPILFCFIPIFWCAFLGGGIALSVHGSNKLAAAESLDPEKDFTYLGYACEISNVDHIAEYEEQCVEWYSTDTGEYCDREAFICTDFYEVSFVEKAMKGSSDLIVYTGISIIEDRDGENVKCESSSQIPSGYTVDQTIECWKPTHGADTIPKSDDRGNTVGYLCNNPQCWKMEDPSDEADAHLENAIGLIGVGAILSIFGGIIAMCWCCCVQKACNQ